MRTGRVGNLSAGWATAARGAPQTAAASNSTTCFSLNCVMVSSRRNQIPDGV
jgi:hypothetical protein